MGAFQLCLDQTGQLSIRSLSISRNMARRYDAYSCLSSECGFEFRLKWPKSSIVQDKGVALTCPACNGLYIEWLTFEMEPLDVYLNIEWNPGLRGHLTRRQGWESPL